MTPGHDTQGKHVYGGEELNDLVNGLSGKWTNNTHTTRSARIGTEVNSPLFCCLLIYISVSHGTGGSAAVSYPVQSPGAVQWWGPLLRSLCQYNGELLCSEPWRQCNGELPCLELLGSTVLVVVGFSGICGLWLSFRILSVGKADCFNYFVSLHSLSSNKYVFVCLSYVIIKSNKCVTLQAARQPANQPTN